MKKAKRKKTKNGREGKGRRGSPIEIFGYATVNSDNVVLVLHLILYYRQA